MAFEVIGDSHVPYGLSIMVSFKDFDLEDIE